MKVHIKYSAQLRTALQRGHESVDLAEASSLATLLQQLAERDEAGRPHLLNDAGNVNPCLLIVVNESAVPAAEAAAVELCEGDVVLLLPPIAGG